ncbi:Hypothetical predicted protein [Paramuricea clavata]|uniref:Uncharacterized protein n=1 Tax=Paramuricea clavata TaxID=317549 RepID=A0A7D9DF10_PARCT|nr:Hypothetical predicted protein [Paramuricea clavata]
MLQRSFDGKNYICRTCHTKLLKDQQPCQAVVNNLFVDETPTELAALEKLEQILVAQRIVFEKIVIMPKGQQRKIKDQENIDEHLQTNVNRELLNEDAEEQDDPLNEHRSAATETCLQSILPNYPVNVDNRNCDNSSGREIFNIAPGEEKYSRSKTLFVSTYFAENRVRFAKKQQELDELDDDSTDIFKSNIIVHYSDRPKNIPVVNDMCLALFAAHYFKDYKSDFNEVSDSQPEVLSDDFIESQNIENYNTGLPDRIKLFYEPDVQEVVQRNKEIFEPDGNEDLRQSLPDDSDETESFNESLPQHLASNPESVQPSSGISSYNQPLEISDDDLR